jgi:hypothetical protein
MGSEGFPVDMVLEIYILNVPNNVPAVTIEKVLRMNIPKTYQKVKTTHSKEGFQYRHMK